MSAPGIVVVTEFCTPDSGKYQDYITYMDRDEATRKKNIDKYTLFENYLNYMNNPEKASGLFTDYSDELTMEQKKQMKDLFKEAQQNGSLMWQTVISFDNKWLKDHGFYDDDIGLVQENQFISVVRHGINAMLKSEKLENAVWTADIHHNTDNIHVHIATVEPEPRREKRKYIQYEKLYEDGKWKYKKRYNEESKRYEKIPILDDKGQLIIREEYKGKFKGKSLKACKSKIVNEIEKNKNLNIEITNIIRQKLLDKNLISQLYDDTDFRQEFIDLYNKMPANVSRNLWTYNSNIMKPLRGEIDHLSNKYIEKYHKEDFQSLKTKIEAQSKIYSEGYGDTGISFTDEKLKDLYGRLGNHILREIRQLDKRISAKEKQGEPSVDMDGIDFIDEFIDMDEEKKYIAWSKNYQKAKEFIFKKQEYEKAYSLLLEEAKKGNALAFYELGDIHRLGLGKEPDLIAANKYYMASYNVFKKMYEEKSSNEKRKIYIAYRIGKMFNYGLGVDKDMCMAADWFEKADNNKYASYLLGNIYYQGEGREKDLKKAMQLYKRGGDFPYAKYKLGVMYERGEGVPININEAQRYYMGAYYTFSQLEEDFTDSNIVYRLGMMEWKGKGVDQNLEKAEKHMKQAIRFGNENAKYILAHVYLKQDPDKEKMEEIVELLTTSADKSQNGMAMYTLGELYNDPKNHFYNQDIAIDWYKKALERNIEYAYYKLGSIYTSSKYSQSLGVKGIEYLEKSAESGNAYAKMKLGIIYYQGKIVPKNLTKAISYLDDADKEGNIFVAGEIVKNIRENGKRKIKGYTAKTYLIDKNELRVALLYLRRTMRFSVEHFLNMERYEELEKDMEKE